MEDKVIEKSIVVYFIYEIFNTATWLAFIAFLIHKSGNYHWCWLLLVMISCSTHLTYKRKKSTTDD